MKMLRYKILLSLAVVAWWSASSFAKENVGNQPKAQPVGAKIAAGCPNTTAQIDLDVNQVRARVLVGGDLWWDPVGQVAHYEVPVGGGKNSIYAGALWVGGFDKSGQLKVAAQTYRQQGSNDMWGGPIAKDPNTGTMAITQQRCAEFDRFWSVTRTEVENFVATGEATDNIKNWPGNGNVANGELPFLAPFFDANNDGTYNYEDGDYPYFLLSGDYATNPQTGETICNDYLFGDKSIWWVFNDVGNIKTETNSAPIGLEVRAQAFAFHTSDQVDFMTFYKYQVINRSSDSLSQTYFGVWCDPDLGNGTDDYVGCDVNLGLGYVFNGDPDDEGAGGYGLNPPAAGIDFFQGPLADPGDGIDNNLNGTIDEPGEQISMSRFVYYVNTNSIPTGNPAVTDDYYDYLSGHWLDGAPITYGGNGRDPGNGNTGVPCNYMFPENTDPLHSTQSWTMSNSNILPDDMRFLESAGTFSLAPGAVNYVTTGVVWARATVGGPLASVKLLKRADNKAQKLFNNCFKVLDGPDAPDIAIRELDQKLILSLENVRTKKTELYSQFDKNIPGIVQTVVNGNIIYDTLTDAQRSFNFQGYKLYQVYNGEVGVSELDDPSRAKLIAQIDMKDSVTYLVNWELDDVLGIWVPSQKTEDVNLGINHTFEIRKDLFKTGELVNYRPYYFMVVAYAQNNFRTFDPANEFYTQTSPYLQGRKNVFVYSGIPHKPLVNNVGTIFNSDYGTGIPVRRLEGSGNAGNALDLAQESIDEIMNSSSHLAVHPLYIAGHTPIGTTVYDPMKVRAGGFKIAFDGIADDSNWKLSTAAGVLLDSSVVPISIPNDQLYEPNKIAFNILKVNGNEPGERSTNNGFIEGTQTFSDPSKAWLTGLQDNDAVTSKNWILSGSAATDINYLGAPADPNEVYEKVLGGTWAPYKLITNNVVGAPHYKSLTADSTKWGLLTSVDVVITNDRSKWSRCVVFETGEDTMPPVGAGKHLGKRLQASVDKNGYAYTDSRANQSEATLVDTVGMGWFPGYAINVETGERLNIAFGENSSLSGENGKDMLWNPTANSDLDNGTPQRLSFGGMHYIYVFARNTLSGTDTAGNYNANVGIYDQGAIMDSIFNIPTNILTTTAKKLSVWKGCVWASIPLLSGSFSGWNFNYTSSEVVPSDVKVRLRVFKNYNKFLSTGDAASNSTNPYYQVEVPAAYEPSVNQTEVAKSALDLIRVVPNPYYAYDTYENTRKDQLDNRVRITNLPSKCTVSFYTLNGTLVRQINRDVISDVSDGILVDQGIDHNLSSTLDWDLKNTAGITVSSGVYIIHIDAGALGEKVVKWFGIMRPIDLDSF